MNRCELLEKLFPHNEAVGLRKSSNIKGFSVV